MVTRRETAAIMPVVGLEHARAGEAVSDGQWAARILRGAIRRGALRPGARLVQRDLAAALGVSRIPVRDALQTLLAEGLVTAVGGRLLVTELTADDVEELYSLRLLIEPALAPWIISNCTRSEAQLLRSFVAQMDDQEKASDQVGWSQTNFAFHDALYAAARRPMFSRIAHQLLSLVESYSRMSTMYLGGWSLSQQEHHVMLEAIDRGDEATLRTTLEIHLTRAQADLVAFLSDMEHARVAQSRDSALGLETANEVESAVQAFVEAYVPSDGSK